MTKKRITEIATHHQKAMGSVHPSFIIQTIEDAIEQALTEAKIFLQPDVSSSADGMGVYCKCGKIIYAVTCEHLKKDTEAQQELINHIANGYLVENVSKEQ